jgi:hypothetical protein
LGTMGNLVHTFQSCASKRPEFSFPAIVRIRMIIPTVRDGLTREKQCKCIQSWFYVTWRLSDQGFRRSSLCLGLMKQEVGVGRIQRVRSNARWKARLFKFLSSLCSLHYGKA